MPPPAGEGEPRSGRNLPLAVATGLVLAGLIFGTLFTATPAFLVLVGTAALAAQWELYRVLAARGLRPAVPLGLAAGAVVVAAAYQRGPVGLSFALSLSVVACLGWFLVEPGREGAAEGVGATLFGVVYVPFLASHVVMLSRLPHGPAITISYIGLSAFYDIAAYASGSLFGRHQMAPGVSPNKSWEGAVGATVAIFVIALAVGPLIEPFTAATAAALAAVTVVAAPLGDLAESMLKRDLDVKDMGTVLPGHGGVLDRIDALLLVAPGAYWLARLAIA